MKKKAFLLFLAAVLLASIFASSGFASPFGLFDGFSVARVLVDNKDVKGDVPAFIYQGRTLVPLRFVSEAMGAEVEWNEDIYTVTITTRDGFRYEDTADEGWEALSNAEDAFRIKEFYRTWNDYFSTLSLRWVDVINLNTNIYFVEQAHYEIFKKYNAESSFASTATSLKELELLRENTVNKYAENIPAWHGNSAQIKNHHALYSYLSLAIINNLWESYYLTEKAFLLYENDYEQYSDLQKESRLIARELEDNIFSLQQESGFSELSWELILDSVFAQNPIK